MVQHYSNEEKKILEDFRHGLIVGSQRFIDHIKSDYLKKEPDIDIPQTVKVFKDTDLKTILKQASELLNCDLKTFMQSSRISKANQKKRDMLIFLLWQTGKYSNKEIGLIFGLTYSSISRRTSIVKINLVKEPKDIELFNSIKSLIKV